MAANGKVDLRLLIGSSKSNYTTVLFTFLPGHIQSIPTTSRQVMTP